MLHCLVLHSAPDTPNPHATSPSNRGCSVQSPRLLLLPGSQVQHLSLHWLAEELEAFYSAAGCQQGAEGVQGLVPETDGVVNPLLAAQTASWTEQVSLA